jgi:hypothetical protein
METYSTPSSQYQGPRFSLAEVPFPPLDTDVTEPRLVVVRSLGNGSLAYLLGIDHFNDPSGPDWELLCDSYGHFSRQPTTFPAPVVITEGGTYELQIAEPQPPVRTAWHDPYYRPYPNGRFIGIPTAEEATRRGGEQAGLRFQAYMDGYEAVSSEPPTLDEISAMVSEFGADRTSLFYWLRYARQYLAAIEKSNELPSYEEYVRFRASHQERTSFELGLNFSPSALQKTYEQLSLPLPLDPLDRLVDGTRVTSQDYKFMYFPFGQGKTMDTLTTLQRMALVCNQIRDWWHSHLVSMLLTVGRTETNIHDLSGVVHPLVIGEVLQTHPGLSVNQYVGRAACKEFLLSQ